MSRKNDKTLIKELKELNTGLELMKMGWRIRLGSKEKEIELIERELKKRGVKGF